MSRQKKNDLDYWLSAEAVNDSSEKVFQLLENGKTHFSLDPSKFESLAQFVAQVTRENYPDLKIPYHSRWKHFEVSGQKRVEFLFENLEGTTPLRRLQSEIDLSIVSVLLDAGAGPSWSYLDPSTGDRVGRSEGLGIATFDGFVRGAFSTNVDDPFRVDGARLLEFTPKDLEALFQVSPSNPLFGLEGRLTLLKRLGAVLSETKGTYAGRPSMILESLSSSLDQKKLDAQELLKVLLWEFSEIWPGRLRLNEKSLGDVWIYPQLEEDDSKHVAFHKLSQWLTFSLLDPFLRFGVEIENVDSLSGLAEYRNGGLFLDYGLLKLKNTECALQEHEASSEIIVEWRALTLALLKRLAPFVRKELNLPDLELPKILEGGTWWAGRRIAYQNRKDGSPPLKLKSDGTVF